MRRLPLLFLLPAAGAVALTVEPQALQQALQTAPLVAEITIEAVTAEKHPTYEIAYKAQARIGTVHRQSGDERDAPQAGDRITLAGPGGELGNDGVFLPGFARPLSGRRYRAYLRAGAPGTYEVVGFEKGLVPLDRSPSGPVSRAFTRNRTDGSNGEGTGPFLFWDDTYFPIPYFISSTSFAPHPDFIAAVDKSFTTWRNVPNTRFEFLAMGCTTTVRNENDGVNAVILMTTSWPFDPAAIAITRNFYIAGASPRAGLVLDTDIMLNGVNHAFTTKDEPGSHDVQNIVTHEAGHFLGLGHEADPIDADATMYASAIPGEKKKRTLHADDIAGIRSAYPGAGNKNGAAPVTATCLLGPPGACLAVHAASPENGILAGFLAGTWLLGLLWLGRAISASSSRPWPWR